MNRYLAIFFLLVSVGAAAQDQPPGMLHEAAHCLVTDQHSWLDPEILKAPEIHLGLRYDTKTFLGDKYLYVIVFKTTHRDTGRIFDIRFKQENHRHVYSVENTATFITTPKGIEFQEPPVGGTWAQNQMKPAIDQIQHHKKLYTAQMKYLIKPDKHVECTTTLEAKEPAPKPE